MTRPSRATIERAAELCNVFASNPEAYSNMPSGLIDASMGVPDKAQRLAGSLFQRVASPHYPGWLRWGPKRTALFYAEAEAMLRNGEWP